MKLLLTGADGFLGRACSRRFAATDWDVVTTDRVGSVRLRGDLANPAFVATLPAVDQVVHTAAVQYMAADLPWLARRRYFEHNNVAATACLCERYRGTGTRFLNIGTSMMYQQGVAVPITARSAMQGQGVYSISKLAAQRTVERAFDHWATVIPCIIGGPGRRGLFNGFVRSAQHRGAVVFPGRGEHPTHMVHVDDVAALIALVVEHGGRGMFNAGGPRPLSIVQWVGEIEAELGLSAVRMHRLPLSPVAALAAASGWRLLAREQVLMLTYPHVLDTAQAQAIGWMPKHDNARIVRDTARAIASAG